MATRATKIGTLGVPFRTTVTTDAVAGQASVAFPAGLFGAPPHVVATAIDAAGDGRDIVVTLVGAPTITGCTVQARKSRTLAASLLSLAVLQGFDTFAPVAAPVTVMATS